MIDFTACQVNKFKGCDGANGNKINVLYDRYKLYAEVSAGTNERKVMSYTNSCISEYLACHLLRQNKPDTL